MGNYKILMCKPTHYGIKYSINPWMNLENQSDYSKSQKQWQKLHDTILSTGAEIEHVEPHSDVPDIVFTANAALIYENKCIISNFKFDERKKEEKFYEEKLGEYYDIVRLPRELNFEGAGDALFSENKLIMAHGFRTSIDSLHAIDEVLELDSIKVKLIDPYFYHLDTCFCPLEKNKAIYFPKAFHRDSVKALNENMDMIPVPENDAKKFACNAVVIGNYVIIPEGCDETKRLLERMNFNVLCCDMSEFLKAGGACKCLTLMMV